MPATDAAISTDPPVSADVDLRDLPWVPFYRHRLWNSRFDNLASDAEFRAGFRLWMRSWDELPAGSLPNDERELAMLAGLGRDLRAWRKVRKWALHGWSVASDGRLYHPVVAEIANEAWAQRQKNRKRTQAARDAQARRNVTEPATDPVTTPVTATTRKTDRNVTIGQKEDAPASALPEQANGHDLNIDIDSKGRSAPLRAAGAPSKEAKKEQLRQKLMRYAHATKSHAEATVCFLGLMGEDNERSAQWWLDTLDIEMRAAKWSDTT